jgi:hypothetical protein
MAEGRWTFKVYEDFDGWRWKLVNRHGTLVMTSLIKFVTEAEARIGAEHELNELRQTVLVR